MRRVDAVCKRMNKVIIMTYQSLKQHGVKVISEEYKIDSRINELLV